MTRRTLTRTIRIQVGDVLEGWECGSVQRIRVLFVTSQTLIAADTRTRDEQPWTLAHRDWRIVRRDGKPFRDDGRTMR